MKTMILSLVVFLSLNASAMDIFCETGMSPIVIKKIKLSRGSTVIEESGNALIKAEIDDYNLATVTVESSDSSLFGKNIPLAETIVAENSATFIAMKYLRSENDDQHSLGGTICGSSEKKVTQLRKYMEKQGKKLGSEVE